MSKLSPRVRAVLSVVVAVATGIVTNLVTESWGWTQGVALALLVCGAIVLALAARPQPARTTVRQKASSGSGISGGKIVASSGAHVRETAADKGRIENSSIRAGNAEAARDTKRSVIRDDEIGAW